MKRKKSSFLSVCLIALAVLLLPGTAAMAYPVQISDEVGTDGGGMFGVWNADTNQFLFNTYCLERNEYVNFTQHYDYTIDPAAEKGGIAGGSPDPISPETAFLYFTFRDDATQLGMDVTSVDDVTAFQYAIWYLENEVTSIPTFYNTKAQSYLALATAAGWSDIGNVRVLNLTYKDARQNTVLAQSMLTLLPVPEPSILILLGLGIFGVGVASRKVKK